MSGPTPPPHPSDGPLIGRQRPGELDSARIENTARVVLVGTWAAVTLIHLVLPADLRGRLWPLSYLLLEALATASLGYRAWRTRGRARLAWGLLAVSSFLEVPNLLLIFLVGTGVLLPAASGLVNLLTLGTGVLVLVGVLSFPIRLERGGTFRRRALDGLLFATSVLFLLWVMGVQGSLRSAAHGVGVRVLVDYLNVALLGGGLVFMTSYHPDRLRGPLGWLAASALAWLLAISCWTLAGLPLTPAVERWMVLTGGIPLFQGLAAWSPSEVVSRATPPLTQGRGLAKLLPYLPVVGAVLTLAALLLWAPLDGMRGAFGIFLGMVVLLLLRQFLAILDLQAARRHLEERVHQRTKALEQAQDTLLRTERMNTLALMGAGLAHDLNNLLCAMKSSADLATMAIEDGQPPVPADLARISTTADRAAMLTRRLMGFVRREAEELSVLDLGGEVREMEATLRLILPRAVDLRVETPGGGSLLVRSSKVRLEQMLVNLVANARDAMPDGGNLTIRAAAAAPDHVVIEVADTGTGIEPEVLERIFEPFFTTKAPGRGTGLGLSSLKAMVEEAEGRLEVSSEPGRGSRFRILLPRVH